MDDIEASPIYASLAVATALFIGHFLYKKFWSTAGADRYRNQFRHTSNSLNKSNSSFSAVSSGSPDTSSSATHDATPGEPTDSCSDLALPDRSKWREGRYNVPASENSLEKKTTQAIGLYNRYSKSASTVQETISSNNKIDKQNEVQEDIPKPAFDESDQVFYRELESLPWQSVTIIRHRYENNEDIYSIQFKDGTTRKIVCQAGSAKVLQKTGEIIKPHQLMTQGPKPLIGLSVTSSLCQDFEKKISFSTQIENEWKLVEDLKTLHELERNPADFFDSRAKFESLCESKNSIEQKIGASIYSKRDFVELTDYLREFNPNVFKMRNDLNRQFAECQGENKEILWSEADMVNLRNSYNEFKRLLNLPIFRRFGNLERIAFTNEVPEWPLSCTSRSEYCDRYIREHELDQIPSCDTSAAIASLDLLFSKLKRAYNQSASCTSSLFLEIENDIANLIIMCDFTADKGKLIVFLNMILDKLHAVDKTVYQINECGFILFFITRAFDYVVSSKSKKWKDDNPSIKETDVCELLCGLVWRRSKLTRPYFEEFRYDVPDFYFSIYSYLMFHSFGCFKTGCYFSSRNQLVRNMIVYFNRFYKDSKYNKENIKIFLGKFLECDVKYIMMMTFDKTTAPWVDMEKALIEHIELFLKGATPSIQDAKACFDKMHTLESWLDVVGSRLELRFYEDINVDVRQRGWIAFKHESGWCIGKDSSFEDFNPESKSVTSGVIIRSVILKLIRALHNVRDPDAPLQKGKFPSSFYSLFDHLFGRGKCFEIEFDCKEFVVAAIKIYLMNNLRSIFQGNKIIIDNSDFIEAPGGLNDLAGSNASLSLPIVPSLHPLLWPDKSHRFWGPNFAKQQDEIGIAIRLMFTLALNNKVYTIDNVVKFLKQIVVYLDRQPDDSPSNNVRKKIISWIIYLFIDLSNDFMDLIRENKLNEVSDHKFFKCSLMTEFDENKDQWKGVNTGESSVFCTCRFQGKKCIKFTKYNDPPDEAPFLFSKIRRYRYRLYGEEIKDIMKKIFRFRDWEYFLQSEIVDKVYDFNCPDYHSQMTRKNVDGVTQDMGDRRFANGETTLDAIISDNKRNFMTFIKRIVNQ